MVRLTVISQTPKEVVLKVEGWISGDGLSVVEQEGERWLREAGRLVLDLGGVQYIDAAGIALLRRWAGDRLILMLEGASPFLWELLSTHRLV